MLDCQRCRESISAWSDGEAAASERVAVSDHLARCPHCAGFEDAVVAVNRRVRLAPAADVPDLTAQVLTAVTREHQGQATRRRDQLRLLVALAGLVQLVVGLTVLLGVGGHLARDLGAFEIALGAGLLIAAWQPHRAGGLLPMAAIVAAVATATSVVDLATGRAAIVAELPHLAEIVGVVLLWALWRHVGDEPAARNLPVGVSSR